MIDWSRMSAGSRAVELDVHRDGAEREESALVVDLRQGVRVHLVRTAEGVGRERA